MDDNKILIFQLVLPELDLIDVLAVLTSCSDLSKLENDEQWKKRYWQRNGEIEFSVPRKNKDPWELTWKRKYLNQIKFGLYLKFDELQRTGYKVPWYYRDLSLPGLEAEFRILIVGIQKKQEQVQKEYYTKMFMDLLGSIEVTQETLNYFQEQLQISATSLPELIQKLNQWTLEKTASLAPEEKEKFLTEELTPIVRNLPSKITNTVCCLS